MGDPEAPRPPDSEADWAASRSAFVADTREEIADERDRIADERERIADERERQADERERRIDLRKHGRQDDQGADGARTRQAAAERRAGAAGDRADAASARSAAGRARDRDAGRLGPADRLLAREFAELAVTLYTADALDKILARVVEVAAEAVPGCERASITLLDDGRPWTPAATDVVADEFDHLQYQLGEGPCLDALGQPMVVASGEEWARWPQLQRVKPAEVASVVSCGFLLPADQPPGALNLYGRAPGAMNGDSQQIAQILAAHAAVALATARERQAAAQLEHGLRDALASRDVIGQAKGILMARQGVPPEEAFDMLRRASQRLNVKLRDVARDVSEGVEVTVAPDVAVDAPTLAAAVSAMLDAAELLPPDRLPDLGHLAQHSGVRSVQIWLADYAQRRLLPFGQPPEIEGFAIDGTVGGRAFLLGEPVELVHDDEVILWAPLIDGINRLGVVRFDLDHIDAYRRGTLSVITKLLASEIVTRGQYTDEVAIARRAQDLTLAAELQWNLLKPLTFATSDVTIAAALEPSYGVGGDGYDYAYNDGVVHAGVFDAVGHDLDAGIIANLLVAAWRWCRRRRLDLSATAETIDRIINERFPDAKYATGVIAELDVATGMLRWINAGHPPPILICGGRVVGTLDSQPAPPLGLGALLNQPMSAVHETSLQPGDRVLLYTDGVVEARTAGGQDFGLDRLSEFVHRAVATGFSGGEMVRRLGHAVVDHHGDHLLDDATIMLIHWHPAK